MPWRAQRRGKGMMETSTSQSMVCCDFVSCVLGGGGGVIGRWVFVYGVGYLLVGQMRYGTGSI